MDPEPNYLKKTRCTRCWAKLPRPIAAKAPRCMECQEGQAYLFGEPDLPAHAAPLNVKK